MTILKSVFPFLISAAGAICFGQGSISGKILTAAGNGAAISNASVQAKNLATQETDKAASAADGSYELTGLAPGAYEISVENVRPSGPTPRASDGKPDLSGLWLINALPSLVGEAPDPLPETEAIAKEFPPALGLTVRCLPFAVSAAGTPEYQVVQTPALIVILDGGWNPTRLIYLDGRGHPKDFNPTWMGHSIGHWDGDTLVVETTGFNELVRVGFGGRLPHTEKLRVTERFLRPDLGHLEVETAYDNPGTFKKPFKARFVKKLAPKD